MDPQALIVALEHQRNQVMNQNAELLASNLVLQKKISDLEKKLSDLLDES